MRTVGHAPQMTGQEYETLRGYTCGCHPPYTFHTAQGQQSVLASRQPAPNAHAVAAYTADQRWQVPHYNQQFADFFADSTPTTNMMEWFLVTEEARRTLGDFKSAWAALLNGADGRSTCLLAGHGSSIRPGASRRSTTGRDIGHSGSLPGPSVVPPGLRLCRLFQPLGGAES